MVHLARRSGIRLHFSSWPVLTLAMALLLAPSPLKAQDASTETSFEDTVDVREILLDVLVTDDDGNVIIGLQADDFVVEDGGQVVPVESVSFYSNRHFLGLLEGETEAPAAATEEGSLPPEDRYFVLLFDQPVLGGPGDGRLAVQMRQAGKHAFRWVVEELLPNDHVAVASYDSELRLHQDFTRDRQRITRAVERAAKGQPPEDQWKSRTPRPEEGISLAPLAAAKSEAEDVFATLEELALGLGSLRGRKNVILFAVDFPRGGTPAKREENFDLAIQALNDSNVAVYTISVSQRGREYSLDRLASETGGDHAFRFQDFLDPLRRIGRENSGYYLLSFKSRGEAPVGNADDYREVSVATTNPEFRVRSRSGYRAGG